jgi:hypothetical protein
MDAELALGAQDTKMIMVFAGAVLSVGPLQATARNGTTSEHKSGPIDSICNQFFRTLFISVEGS